MRRDEAGILSLEFGLSLPLLLLAVLAALQAVVLARDVLIAHEAARVGARAAATSSGTAAVAVAVEEAIGTRPVGIEVRPESRRTGDVARVTVRVTSRIGPHRFPVTATAANRVEPGVVP